MLLFFQRFLKFVNHSEQISKSAFFWSPNFLLQPKSEHHSTWRRGEGVSRSAKFQLPVGQRCVRRLFPWRSRSWTRWTSRRGDRQEDSGIDDGSQDSNKIAGREEINIYFTLHYWKHCYLKRYEIISKL